MNKYSYGKYLRNLKGLRKKDSNAQVKIYNNIAYENGVLGDRVYCGTERKRSRNKQYSVGIVLN